jgi:hypothetical protein
MWLSTLWRSHTWNSSSPQKKTHFPLRDTFFGRNIMELIFFITRAINHSEVAFIMRFFTHWSHLDFIFIRISLILMFLLWTHAFRLWKFFSSTSIKSHLKVSMATRSFFARDLLIIRNYYKKIFVSRYLIQEFNFMA